MITIQQDVPLAPLTSLQIGGPARFFTTAYSIPDLREAVTFAHESNIPFAVLGGGSNVLFSDDGFDGLVIKLKLEGVAVAGDYVKAEAGVDLTWLVHRTGDWGLGGIESLAGIPGQVGGAVRGNAGAYGSCIGDFCVRIFALESDSLELVALDRQECRFKYRSSRFKEDPRMIVVSALLGLSPGNQEEIRRKVQATLERRAARNLQCERSVGSFFMNPVVTDPELIGKFETDQHARCRESRIPAGWLIDQAGLRNTSIGGATVSPSHANYLINGGTATACEMLRLASLVRSRVQAAMGVALREEVSCLGFPAPIDLSDPDTWERPHLKAQVSAIPEPAL